MALMQKHFATKHLGKKKQQLCNKMHMIQFEPQCQQYQAAMPLLLLTSAQLTQPIHTKDKLNGSDHLSGFVSFTDDDLHNYHFKQVWNNGTTPATTQLQPDQVPLREQKIVCLSTWMRNLTQTRMLLLPLLLLPRRNKICKVSKSKL